jgi:hypothetical protein
MAYVLSKKLDDELGRLHLEKLGVTLTRLSKGQADYIRASPDGPHKSDHYRYGLNRSGNPYHPKGESHRPPFFRCTPAAVLSH